MAQPSDLLLAANLAPVIGSQYCLPYQTEIAIIRKVLAITDGNFVVADVDDNILFKVKALLGVLHDRRLLVDAAGNPIVTLRKKVMTEHSRWQVFRGDSKEQSDMIFCAKRSHMFQLKAELKVYLANTTRKHKCDFKVKGSWLERSCTIYAGDSSSIVAQMHKKHSAQSILFGKDKFMVKVYPYVDYAFIAALIVILDDINHEKSSTGGGVSVEFSANGDVGSSTNGDVESSAVESCDVASSAVESCDVASSAVESCDAESWTSGVTSILDAISSLEF